MCKIKLLKQYKYIPFIIVLASVFFSCKTTKYVPNDRYLLKKNSVSYFEKAVPFEDVYSIIKQYPNRKLLGIKWNLLLYNAIDSSKVAQKRLRKNYKLKRDNLNKILKENKINTRRIERAKKKGEDSYKKKVIPLKDTLEPKLFFKEWLKYKVGESPVVFDSLQFKKTIEQLSALQKNKGFYYGEVLGKVKYNSKRKSKVEYQLDFGKQYLIDSVYLISSNPLISELFFAFEQDKTLKNQAFEVERLENYRNALSKYMRNNAVYNFTSSFVNFIVDTNKLEMKVSLGVAIEENRKPSISNPDSLIVVAHKRTYIKNVHFHILDTLQFKGGFKSTIDSLGIPLVGKYIPTVDSFYFNETYKRNSKELNESRVVYFYYNGDIFVSPSIIEAQSLLEKGNLLRENYIEDSYTRLQNLLLFQTIKMEVEEVEGSDEVDIHYYLTPSKKESFSFQPRVSSSNGFLGISAGLNYTNKNLFKGAERLTFGLNGGFQSQPVIFDELEVSNDIATVTNRLYQFEISPSVKYEVPGLMMIKRSKVNKSRNGKTFLSSAYSYQNRDVFSKEIFQLNYTWQYDVGKKQRFSMGVPGLSQIKFVNINKSLDFDQKLNELNDLFLKNTYSNQFIWEDWKLVFEYKSTFDKDKKYASSFYMRSSLDLAGNLLHLFRKYQEEDTTGQHLGQNRLFGLVYSQFTRLDNEIIFTKPISKKKSINMHLLTVVGLPYGNSNTSMPYDYSFYAGGSNDVRGWRARSLGPGSYKYYLDTGRTAVQVADIRISASAEYRFEFSEFLKGALFLDAGNIWTLREDENRVGSKFSSSWFKELALASGVGFRMDFDFFLIRFDLGFKLHNPAMPKGEKWIFQSRDKYNQEIKDFIIENEANGGTVTRSKIDTTPFRPQISFGIGYPF